MMTAIAEAILASISDVFDSAPVVLQIFCRDDLTWLELTPVHLQVYKHIGASVVGEIPIFQV
jgi:hypothetical protein